MHGRLFGIGIFFFFFVSFVLLVVAFGQKGLKGRRTSKKKETAPKELLIYIHTHPYFWG